MVIPPFRCLFTLGNARVKSYWDGTEGTAGFVARLALIMRMEVTYFCNPGESGC